MEIDSIVTYAIRQGIRMGIEAYKQEEKARKANPRILVVKSKAEKMVGGRMVLKSLEKRGFIFPYQFGVEEMIDEDGEPFKRAQGRIYYKLSELCDALEDGNLLKDLRRVHKQLKWNTHEEE